MSDTKHQKYLYEYICIVTIIAILFLSICATKKIFPFGNARIDISDFEQESVPVYYHLWDVLHGRENLLFTWHTGGGLDLAGVNSFFALVSPFSLFFLFIKRSWIEPSMTFYILIKYIAMGISMCFFLRNCWKTKAVRLPSLWIIIGSTAYALSAYSVQYYLFPWLDIAAVFPLLIYAFLQMTAKEPCWKSGRYSISYLLLLTLIFIMHIPQAYMVCLYLFLFAGGYFILYHGNSPREPSGTQCSVLKFALLSLLALGLSFFLFFPGAISIMESGRMSDSSGSLWIKYLKFLQETGIDPSVKRIMLYCMFIPLAYLVLTARRKTFRHRGFEYLMVIAVILPVFVENINVIWLMGPYNGFPMRYGYMMIFTILAAAGNRMTEQLQDSSAVSSHFFFPGWKKTECAITFVWLVSIFALGIWLIRPGITDEYGSFVSNSEEVSVILPRETDLFHKTKLADSSLNNNYPLITRTHAFSNYTHLVSQKQLQFNKVLGYAQVWTRISDTGGTLFSDALLGYQTTFKTALADEQGWELQKDNYSLYNSLGQSKHFISYENVYCYPPGLTISETDLGTYQNSEYSNPFELQNALSGLFFDETLFTISDYEVTDEETILLTVSGDGVVYLYSDDLKDSVISVNGQEIPVPDFFYGITDNTYPSPHHQGILGLGTYTNTTVEVNIRHHSWTENIENSHVFLAVMDLNKYIGTTERENPVCNYDVSKKGLSLMVETKVPSLLYLPIYSNEGWNCTVNGNKCHLQTLSDTFLLVPLSQGENQIELQYTSRGMLAGIIVSLISFLLLLLWCILSKQKEQNHAPREACSVLYRTSFTIFVLIYAVFMLLVYIIPVIYTIIRAVS